MSSTQKLLPEYQCHKKVRALKISEVVRENALDGRVTIIPENIEYDAFEVSSEYYAKHTPLAGGYYVVYEDNYQSYSPAAVFESGYTKI